MYLFLKQYQGRFRCNLATLDNTKILIDYISEEKSGNHKEIGCGSAAYRIFFSGEEHGGSASAWMHI